MKQVALLLLITIPITCFSEYKFKKITTKEGLSLDNIDCIAQDREGLLYFGANEINLYDGNSIQNYSLVKTSGFGSKVKAIIPISTGKILFGTLDSGLFLFDKETERITPLPLLLNSDSLNLPIISLHDDQQGKLWIGTLNRGLFSIEIKDVLELKIQESVACKKYPGSEDYEINSICSSQQQIWLGTRFNGLLEMTKIDTQFSKLSKSEIPLSSQNIWTIKRFGNSLFIGTQAGLNIFHFKTMKSNVYLQKPSNPTLSNNIIRAICKDKFGTLWVGTQEDGLYALNFRNKEPEISHYKNIPTNSNTLNVNKILSLYTDRHNNLWIGTWNGGVNLLNLHDQQFITIRNKGKANNLSENMIWAIAEKAAGEYWLGTHGSGLCKFEKDQPYFSEQLKTKTINSVSDLYFDKNRKILWVGTWGNGLKAFSYPHMNPEFSQQLDSSLLKEDRIYQIVEDEHGVLWIGTVTHGLFSINLKNNDNTIKQHPFFKQTALDSGLKNVEIRAIIPDKNNVLWIGSLTKGLFKAKTDDRGNIVDMKSIQSIKLPHEKQIPIRSLYLDSQQTLWIGQENGVIKCYNTQLDSFKLFTHTPNNIASAFTEDHKGNIWIASYHGLISYHIASGEKQEFLTETCFYTLFFDTKTNEMITGSNKGIFSFYPSQLKKDPFYPEIIFSELKIFNTTIKPGEKIEGTTPLTKAINYTEQLTLPYSCNVFTINTTALSYSSQHKNQLYYKLENFERSWNQKTGAATSISYTNLSPGEYTLKVKTANKDNTWNPKIRHLKIKILPPWWRTDMAYTGYSLIVMLIGFIIYRIIKARIDIKQALHIEKIKQEQKDQLNELKLSFFTNISHEIRTPLTLILGPLESMLQDEQAKTPRYRQLTLMQKNANLLLNMVNEVLDFRKMEKEKITLKVIELNLNEFILQILGQFEGEANRKNITLKFFTESQNTKLWADENLLQKILFNLISNAIRFTPPKGSIQLSIEENQTAIRITVADNGIGIESKDLPQIFDRFYQSSYSNTSGGSGIGLSLVKTMVELHKGSLSVESQPGKGSSFAIEFQKGKAHYSSTDIRDLKFRDNTPGKDSSIEEKVDTSSSNRHRILIIDDNDDMRFYLKESLTKYFNIIDFDNAREGFTYLLKNDISLIVCDIMMPGIDGIEFCKQIKSELKTSHIPIILLTAKTATESIIEGYEKGADDYIGKPFSIELVKTRINNLIAQRERLQQKIKTLNLEPSNISPTSLDEQFLRKTIALIEQNISNHDYTAEHMGKALGISPDSLYRKIKNLTGMSTTKFIRMIRLKRAAQLLKSTDYTISEILYGVGFTNPSYFAKCFKQQFGISASEYQKHKTPQLE
ncbi:two-component regulator propeller domain-containing protein [Sunxiuqinia elliptica]|uniref:histidine kinase n=1 Tax=Sunxiuqinia elliptica TaxID=655355 RepID=A0A1I2GW82_9BACT|nr:two-component regulator propeller domain-containing protein [Sunxiuqinia elliptica]SFF20841.1 Two component regulator propeller [Sunxiuqinia elliptica]